MARKNDQPKSVATTILLALAAGVVGGGAVWLVMRSDAPTPPPGAIAATERAESPPSVEHMPPAQAAVTLANWNYDRQNWTHAIEHYEQAIRLGADNADIRTDLGNCFRFLAQPQKALEQYQIAQRLSPQHENSLFNTAGLYGEALRDPAKAAESWREYLRRFPNAAGAARARQSLAEAEQHATDQATMLKRLISEDGPKQQP